VKVTVADQTEVTVGWMVLVAACCMTHCTPSILRERDVYVTEMTFTDRLLREGSPAVRDYVTARCLCASGVWRANDQSVTDRLCQNYAEWWVVYRARWDWHHQMMLFNARMLDARPGPAPVIPPVTCDLPNVQVN
jgi:hypothetical protein